VEYRFHPTRWLDPRSIRYINKTTNNLVRSCQTNHLKQLQLDEVGYNYCEKCGNKTTIVELHHTLEVAKHGLNSINSAGHILLCSECHKELTKQCNKQ
jgi:5-methylcytosine-specific restriction endonuclease McrA